MFVEFDKCRIDYAVARDPNRPALNFVFMDLEREVMFAADGFLIVVKAIRVEHSPTPGTDPEGVLAIHFEAMGWLLGVRGKDVRLWLRKSGDDVIVQNVNRTIVTTPMEQTHHELVKSLRELLEKHRPADDAKAWINVDLRRLIQVYKATGLDYAYIVADEDEPGEPYFIAQGDAAAILSPIHAMDLEKSLENSRALIDRARLGPEDREVKG